MPVTPRHLAHLLAFAGGLLAQPAVAQTTITTRNLLSPPMTDNNRYVCQLQNASAQAVTVSRFEFTMPEALYASSPLPLLTHDLTNCSLLGGPMNFSLPAGRACWIRVTLPYSINWATPGSQVNCRVRHTGPAGALIGAIEARHLNISTGVESEARALLPLQEVAATVTTLP